MQWLAQVCVRRPVFTWVLVLSLVVVGGASFFGLGVDRFPKIDFPAIIVTTVLPGASPEQIETEVTEPIEEQLNSISGLDELTSSSYEGFSVVVARFDLEKDVGEASEEVRDRVGRVVSELPEGVEQPRVERVDPDAAPIMYVAVRTNRSAREATDFADRVLRRRIESMNGVGGIAISGAREREIQIVTDPTRLASFGLTARDVQVALARENVEIPGGNVEQGTRTFQLRVAGRIENPQDFALVPIREREGRVIRVGDVAQVLDAGEQPESSATIDGESVVVLSIRKQSGANTVAVIDALRGRIAEIQRDIPPSYRLEIVRDESEFIRNSIHAVQEHLIVGGFLAALVVLLFLRNGRSTVITALAIPTSIIATFALIAALGLTLNVITLLGLTLSVGIVIDDAIVVLENIVRYIEEKGYDPRRAAVVATKEIGLAVLATSLSLVAVFLPIAFMGGIIGRFMSSFGYTMSFAIIVSLFVSFTLTPMLSSRWLKGPVRAGRPSRPSLEPETPEEDDLEIPDPAPGDRRAERETYLAWQKGQRNVEDLSEVAGGAHESGGWLYQRMERAYMWLLALSMRHRWAVGIVLVISLVSLGPMTAAVPKNFLPNEDESRFEITVRAPEGTSLAQTQIVSERIARAVRELPEVDQTVLTVGAPAGDPSGRGANQSSLYVRLVPADRRERSQDETIEAVRSDVLPRVTPEGVDVLVNPVAAFGGSGQQAAPIQYVLSGPDLNQLDQYVQRMLTEARQLPGVAEASTSLVTGRPAYEIQVDRRRAADLGVSVVDIASAMQLMVGGVEVTDYSEAGEQYEVRVRADADFRSRPEDIAQITVPSATGQAVRLSDVAEIVPTTGPASIQHLGRQRQATIFISTRPGASEQAIVQGLEQIRAGLDMEPGYGSALSGRSREMGRALQSFLIAVFLSFTFMYLVLAAQFESWIHPVTILASLPLTLPFAIFSVLALGQSLNIYSMLGVLVLFGVVKKNSILQIDHIRGLRRKGLSRADAVMLGNRDRLRPILMTTIAFVAGMVPLLVSSGAGSGTNRAMGSVIAGGQTLSLLLTLIATPVIFSWLDDLSHSRVVKFGGRVMLAPFQLVDRLVSKKETHAPAHAAHPAHDERPRDLEASAEEE
ncbi:efflux RND transporter permease subunit [Sandaracinus amylolyticus]|uniref:efflux RND transporter permease subunit n=1 Tax=Sandaracinus amylolyticus TaxID=927083 RepID=UPI0009FAE049|nr:efflux RND transporter permease subunit [Sandaracinus amylolyticus]